MRHRLLLPFVAAVLACVSGGKNPDSPADLKGRARQFHDNFGLIEVLVENSIRLAEEDDPLKRAQYCNGLVERLSAEMKTATQKQDLGRVEELGQHVHDLLSQGMAANLRSARQRAPESSTMERDLQSVRAQTEQSLAPVEEQLQQAAGGEEQGSARRVLKLIRDARTELDRSLNLNPPSDHKDAP
jgi:DNA anti-recombination protein RmuC